MACHECGGKVSTSASACPHCGAPVDPERAKAAEAQEVAATRDAQPEIATAEPTPEAAPPPPPLPPPSPQEPVPPDSQKGNWLARQPLWIRLGLPFVVIVAGYSAVNLFQAWESAERSKKVQEMANRAVERSEESVAQAREAIARARAAKEKENERIAALLVGDWESSGDVMKVEGGEVRSVTDTYSFTKDGQYYNWSIFEMIIDESPLFSGRYRLGTKGTFAIKDGKVLWSPTELTTEPIYRSSYSMDKRQAMAVLAQQMSDDLEESDDAIVIVNDDEFIMQNEMVDGAIFSVRYKRSEEGL